MWTRGRRHFWRRCYTGAARRGGFGRVDHQNAFLDTDEQERARGITIFQTGGAGAPGGKHHVSGYAGTCGLFRRDGADASGAGFCAAACERDRRGAEPHENALAASAPVPIPTFLFVNKMDLPGKGKTASWRSSGGSSRRAAWPLTKKRRRFMRNWHCLTKGSWSRCSKQEN